MVVVVPVVEKVILLGDDEAKDYDDINTAVRPLLLLLSSLLLIVADARPRR